MGCELTGDWDKFLNLKNIESAMREHMGDALERGAELLRGNVVKYIRDQKGNWPPLAESTVKQKAAKNQSDLILIAEGDYESSFATDRKSWDEVQMGSNHPQSRALEFGYEPRGLQARPHFWPAMEEGIDGYLNELQQGLATMFQSLMR